MSPTPIEVFREGVESVVRESSDDLDQALERLEVTSDEVKFQAAKLAALGIEVSVLKLAGTDTSVAEKSLLAAAQNLRSVANTEVARETLRFAQSQVVNVGAGVLKMALALL